MTPDILIGCIVLITALAVIAAMALWSRRTVEKIADKQLQSAREIVQALGGEDE